MLALPRAPFVRVLVLTTVGECASIWTPGAQVVLELLFGLWEGLQHVCRTGKCVEMHPCSRCARKTQSRMTCRTVVLDGNNQVVGNVG